MGLHKRLQLPGFACVIVKKKKKVEKLLDVSGNVRC